MGSPRDPALFATDSTIPTTEGVPFHPKPSTNPQGPAGAAGLPPQHCPNGPDLGTPGVSTAMSSITIRAPSY